MPRLKEREVSDDAVPTPGPERSAPASRGSGANLRLEGLHKSFGRVAAVRDVDLDIEHGEFVTLLGSSGSGKTTTLNLIAGFLFADQGRVLMDDADISSVPPHRRNIGMVFQDYLLFPHMSAAENVAFPLKRRKVDKGEARRRVADALEMVGLAGFEERLPRQMSGGQQQRVALARALVFEPRLLLMDEPLGALDRNLRETLQLEIKRIHRDLATTFVYVTHDQEEALVLSDRVAVFRDGTIEQIASPTEIYERPATAYVADFIGDSNIFRGRAEATGGVPALVVGDRKLPAPATGPEAGDAALIVRPECVVLDADFVGAVNLAGTVTEVVYLGAVVKVVIDVPGLGPVVARENPSVASQRRIGDQTSVGWRLDDSRLVPTTSA